MLRHAAGTHTGRAQRRLLDQCELPWFVELNRGLRDALDDEAIERRIRDNAAMLHVLAAEIVARVRALGADIPPELTQLAAFGACEESLLRAA